MSLPLLTIVTRCCQRPQMLAKNIESVAAQKDNSVEQVFLVDLQRRGRLHANKELRRHPSAIVGDYVYMLDDDCRLIHPRFVERLRNAVKHKPDVVMVKSMRPQLKPYVLPRGKWGDTKMLQGRMTNCLCYVVKRRVWLKHIVAFGTGVSGAGRFLDAVLKSNPTVIWLDVVAAETLQLGRDKDNSFERVTADWWERVVAMYRIEKFDGDWRIRHWLQ